MKWDGLHLPQPWTASHRGVLIGLLSCVLVYTVVRLILNPVYVSNPQPQIPARASELEDRIDPNSADWQTLAALPNIGQKRAEDIVAYREKYQMDHDGKLPFNRPEDLLPIRGIGTAMMTQLEPYLRFPSLNGSTTQP
jgi:DNA uptake protein ComE-like DNA-binding protein